MVTMYHGVSSDVPQRRPKAKHNKDTLGSLLWWEKLPNGEDTDNAMPSLLGLRYWSMPLYLPIQI